MSILTAIGVGLSWSIIVLFVLKFLGACDHDDYE